MAIQTFKIWAHRSIESGARNGTITIFPFAPNPKSDFSPAVSAGEFEVELDILEDENNAAEIEALEARLQTERADSMQRQNILFDRISKLKAIGHDAPADDDQLYTFHDVQL